MIIRGQDISLGLVAGNTLSDLNRDYTATYNRLNLVASLVGPVGLTGPKVGYLMPSGKTRLPDLVTPSFILEVKNYSKTTRLGFSSQLRDYAAFAQQSGREFYLYVPKGFNNFTKPLRDAIQSGAISIRRF